MENTNETRTIMGVKYDSEEGTFKEVYLSDVESSYLEAMKEHIGCEFVDCMQVTDKIDVWFDDEFLFAGSKTKGLEINGQQILGNMLFLANDGRGNCSSLNIFSLAYVLDSDNVTMGIIESVTL